MSVTSGDYCGAFLHQMRRHGSPLRRHGNGSLKAGYDCDADAPRSALAAVYMGYFHAARAVLYRDGVREKSHYCIGVYLESYREKGLLEDEWVLQFDHMRGLRQNDQYSLDARPTIPEVRQAQADAEKFIDRMERLVNKSR